MGTGRDRGERPDYLAALHERVGDLEEWRERRADPHIDRIEQAEGKRAGRRELWADISKIIGALVTLGGGIIAVLAFAGLGY